MIADSDAPPPEDGRTVIAPETSAGASTPRRAPRREIGLEPGDLLNGIYRVDRFVARGGMGEVFEGVNIESDERVAIKAIRGHLAADPKVRAMFRKEAQILTRITHPAVVQYRVLARDPDLDLYYIVTDFIDGEPLAAHLDGRRPSPAAVLRFARRLVAGLEAAHDYGAIHRDMSPDNILLPGGVLERAKIIDFGIAKSLELGAETVVGDGFAGKLGYVAPEQFGDYDRALGPWTDVYSTALVLLAYARGKAPDMGKTLSEAIARRREPPDLADLPPALAPLFRRMLAPDPAERLRSMAAVRAEIDALPPLPEAAPETTEAAPDAPPTLFAPAPPVSRAMPARRATRRWAPLALLVPALAAGGLMLRHGRGDPPAPPSRPPAAAPLRPAPPPRAPAASGPAAAPTPALPEALAAMPCAWLGARTGGGALRLAGAAGDPATLDAQLRTEAASHGLALPRVIAADVLPVDTGRCALLEAGRALDRADGPGLRLFAGGTRIALAAAAPGCGPGAARADLTLIEDDPRRDLALLALDPDGGTRLVAGSRAALSRLARTRPALAQDGGDGRFQVGVCFRAPGVAGLVLLDAPAPLGLDPGAARSASALAERLSAGAAAGWRSRAVWLRVLPPDRAGTAPAPPLASVAAAPPAPAPAPAAPLTPAPALAATESLRPAFKSHSGATDSGDFAACRRWSGKQWDELGYSSRAICVERVFKNRCEIVSGQFGETPLRRYGGRIEMQRGSRWTAIGTAEGC
ncbi:serine/threonine-protein kinase [Sphingomonas morindae]|uniref:Serine/threonine protein kinase n=1 Tax=Sphingomonas morindae TaxID=1541170 RepID=A0ABY4XDC6_9SPHN|nr:serine/threonine-protein kinase [Sphingomonas morindae]USI74907.1 serine/threonine protein kinase [Sphingomonas morindae]